MSQRYFDPDGLARVGDLEMVARQAVEGFLTGRHQFLAAYLEKRARSG